LVIPTSSFSIKLAPLAWEPGLVALQEAFEDGDDGGEVVAEESGELLRLRE
jgi:hypothetical protein